MARPIFVRFDVPAELATKSLEALELARDTGRIKGPHPTSGNRSRRMRQVTVIMAGLLGKGLPSPFFPVTLRLKPCGLF
jgi:hypothetical protein